MLKHKETASRFRSTALPRSAALALLGAALAHPATVAQTPAPVEAVAHEGPTYADLVDLGLAASVVAVVRIDRQTVVPAARAPGVPPGHVRLHLQASMQSLMTAPSMMGGSLVFVVDVPFDSRGRRPRLRNEVMLVFGDLVPGTANALQLLSSASMMRSDPALEARVRDVLGQLAQGSALGAVSGVSNVIFVPGNLAGESETQMFVETASGAPVSLSVIRRPGMTPAWGLSLGEIVDQSARPPAPETIAWYRLACELPAILPDSAFLQTEREARARANADYDFIREQLGACKRRL